MTGTPGMQGRIVFASGKNGDYDLFRLTLATGEVLQLTQGDCWNDRPTWSPDGSQVLFVSNRSGTPELWVTSSDGGEAQRLTQTDRWNHNPTWSPDGSAICFLSNRSGKNELWMMRADGTKPAQLTDSPGSSDHPAFSPDGKRIAFTSDRDGHDALWILNLESHDLRKVTSHEGRALDPTWSPDGTTLAYVSNQAVKGWVDDDFDIWRIGVDNGQPAKKLTDNQGTDRGPSFSPCGGWVVYSSAASGSTAERLHVVPSEGGRELALDVARGEIEAEIEADTHTFKLGNFFSFLPASVVRETHGDAWFGMERNPAWGR